MKNKQLIAAVLTAFAFSAAHTQAESRRIEARAKQSVESASAPEIVFSAGTPSSVNAVSYSPDGKYIASGSYDKTIKIWDAATGMCLRTQEGHSESILSVSYSPDGKYIASGSRDKTIKIWDAATGMCLRTLEGHSGDIDSVCYSPDGKYIAGGGGWNDKTVKIWEAATGECLRTLEGHSGDIDSVCYSPDGKYIAGGSWDKTIKIWEAATGECLRTLEGHSGDIDSVCYSPDGKYLASGGGWNDKTVKIWNAASGECIRTLEGHTDNVISVRYSPDGRYIASTSRDKTVKIWDAENGSCVFSLTDNHDWILDLRYSPDGKYLAGGMHYGSIKIWDAATGTLLRIIEGHSPLLTSVTDRFDEKDYDSFYIFPDSTGKYFAIKDDTTQVFETVSGNCILPEDYIDYCDFSPDGTQFAGFTYKGHEDDSETSVIKAWDIAKRKLLWSFEVDVILRNIFYCSSGQYISGYTTDGTMEIWDAATGKHIKTIADNWGMRDVGYSPDGRYIAGLTTHNRITLWDAKTKKKIRDLDGQSSFVSSISFRPDGKYLASGGFDGTIKIWELANGNCIKTIKTGFKKVLNVNYTPDGKHLIGMHYDYNYKHGSESVEYSYGRIIVWDAESGSVLSEDWYDDLSSVCCTTDGTYMLCGKGYGYDIYIYDLKNKKEIAKIEGYTDCFSVSPDNNYAATYDADNTVKIWELATGKLVKTLDGQTGYFASVGYSPDGRSFACGYMDGTVKILDAKTGELLRTFTGHYGSVYSVNFSPDGNSLISCAKFDENINIWDVKSGTRVGTLKGQIYSYNAVFNLNYDVEINARGFNDVTVISQWDSKTHTLIRMSELPNTGAFDARFNGFKYVAASTGATDYNKVQIFDLATNKVLRTLGEHSGVIRLVQYSPDGRMITSASADGTVKFWDAASGALLATLYQISSGDFEWICHTPEGFFSGSEWAAKNFVHIVDGVETVGIDQVFTSLYRPDLVAAKLSGKDISAYADKVNLASLVRSGSAPHTAFLHLPQEADSRDLRLECAVTNTGGGIGSVNLVLNGKNIRLGENILSESGQTFIIEHIVTLQNGENTLELYATNGADKVESLRAAETVMWRGNVKKPNLYVLTAAVNRYRDKNLRLKHAVSDAEAISKEFAAQKKSLYQNIFTVNLFDGDVTKENLAASFQKLSAQVEADDVFVFYIAGHGTTYEDGDYYYLPSDFRYIGSESIAEGGISKNDFTKFLSLIKAGKTLILLDTCQSGAFLSTEARGGLTEKTAIDRLTRATGHATIAASSDLQDAMEGYNGHGIFTYTVVEGLSGKADADNDGFITLQELSSYTETEVPRRSYEKWGYEQIPQRDLRRQDFPIYTRKE